LVLTSDDQLGNTGRKTAFWLEEFAAPYSFSEMPLSIRPLPTQRNEQR